MVERNYILRSRFVDVFGELLLNLTNIELDDDYWYWYWIDVDTLQGESSSHSSMSWLVRFPNSLGCELGERRSYSLWIELPGVFLPIFFIGRGKLGTELESSTQNLGSLISQTFKNLIGSAAERHFSLPPVCHFFGRPDIRAVFVLNKFRICEKLHFRFLPWFPDRFALNSGGNAL